MSDDRPQAQESLELSAALGALASFQSLTQHADAKANMLLVVQVGIGAVIGTQVPAVAADHMTVWQSGVIMAYVVSFCVLGSALIQVMRPRLGCYPARNAFAVNRESTASSSPSSRPLEGVGEAPSFRSEEVWEVAQALAVIAALKNRHMERAIIWTSIMVVIVVVWFTITTFRA
jgi:hypothetical protein